MTSQPVLHDYQGGGAETTGDMGYSQAVRIGNFLKTSGQSGWQADGTLAPSMEAQISRSFENAMHALQAANPECEWRHVYSIKTYHIDTVAQFEPTVAQIKRRMPQRPIWVCSGTANLPLEGLLVEIELEAYVPGSE